ncbi:hypothetical protein GYMLUDRAFT_49660 [Collybiopsis luxurians FD-317 M1]|uniref:Unplaced genomic scaffold GYMLUscaffold_88, whole genome shotgun sequence n=1 Tax=Collybiopsis luxurians FD-317 M1 TaxID=944289 RepID=A0A0D0C4S1_9AGAR|nr:hypothetical protein GYMLUDRAFT_49660 [Collybiopsis luxurians FD-317 M1]
MGDAPRRSPTISSNSPPPPSALHAYQLRNSVNLNDTIPTAGSSSGAAQVLAPKPSIPFSQFSFMNEDPTTLGATYPPPPNGSEPHHSLLEYADAQGEDGMDGLDAGRRNSLASPPPRSSLPYSTQSRPSSSTGFLSPKYDLDPSSPAGISGLPASFSASPYPLQSSLRPGSGSMTPATPTPRQPRSASSSRSSSMIRDSGFSIPQHMIRIPSEETRVLAQARQAQGQAAKNSAHPAVPPRGSVVLYRLDDSRQDTLAHLGKLNDVEALLPPNLPFGGKAHGGRQAQLSMDEQSLRTTGSRQSFMSGDSRIPLFHTNEDMKGAGSGTQLVAYAYQPDALLDGEEDDEDDDWLHDPRVSFFASLGKGKEPARSGYVERSMSVRGVVNYIAVWLLLVGLVALFVFYPVVDQLHGQKFDDIANNPNINSTGQATAR